jgi:hypothetical protein
MNKIHVPFEIFFHQQSCISVKMPSPLWLLFIPLFIWHEKSMLCAAVLESICVSYNAEFTGGVLTAPENGLGVSRTHAYVVNLCVIQW